MPPFLRVDQNRACASAVGILVPPGRRTVVIIRPRALAWDLLPVRIEQGVRSGFCQFDREEAAIIARAFARHLTEAVTAAADPVVVLSIPSAENFQIGVQAGEYCWISCVRAMGHSYEPLAFRSQEEAEKAAQRLSEIFYPGSDANQEYYFNTQHFKDR